MVQEKFQDNWIVSLVFTPAEYERLVVVAQRHELTVEETIALLVEQSYFTL